MEKKNLIKIIGLFVLTLVFTISITTALVLHIVNKPEASKIQSSEAAAPAESPKIEAQNDFNTLYSTGLKFFNKKEFRLAAGYFYRAGEIKPRESRAKYYLMKCYANLEESPYAGDSDTVKFALEVKSLAPESREAREATKLLRENEIALSQKEEAQKSAAIAADNPEENEPSIFDPPAYPTAKPAKKAKPGKIAAKPSKKPEENLQKSEEKPTTATLSGRISRPDEKGLNIFPSGVEIKLSNGKETYTTTTDSDGKFEFTGIKPGKEYVMAAISPYKFVYYLKQGLYMKKPEEGDRFSQGEYSAGDRSYIYADWGEAKSEKAQSEELLTPYGYYCEISRPVQRSFNLSWHLRMDLENPIKYKVDLNKYNNDKKFSPEINPNYASPLKTPYKTLTEIKPVSLEN